MLDWKEFIPEIQEVLAVADNPDVYQSVTADLNDGLETNEFSTSYINGKVAILFGRLIFWDLESLRQYFKIQPKISETYYKRLCDMLQQSEARSRFVEYLNKLCGDPNTALILYMQSTVFREGFTTAVMLENTIYTDKDSIIQRFSEKSQSNWFTNIECKCNTFEYLNDSTIICDGLALITTSRELLESPMRNKYAIEGLLDVRTGKITWLNYIEKAYTPKRVGTVDLNILKVFLHGEYLYYKTKMVQDNSIIEKPYPIGILQDNSFVFAYKELG